MSLDTLEREDWNLLVEDRHAHCVSIYLPTHRRSAETQQDPVRLKNLLRQAESRLVEVGASPAEAAEILRPVRALIDDYPFWQHQSEGLALFAAPGLLRTFRLPLPFREQAVVADRFFVRPLLPLLATEGRFYVLALSLNQVRLFEGDLYELRRLPTPGVPANYEEALGYDEFSTDLQAHSAGPASLGHRAGILHGHGGGDEENFKKDVQQYFRLVSQGIEGQLRDRDAPLVLATVEAHIPLFRGVCHHPALLEDAVLGNPELLGEGELHARAWAIVEPWLLRRRDQDLMRLRELSGRGRAASAVDEVVRAAHEGRVETLFIRDGAEAWGSYDPETGRAEVHTERRPEDEDLAHAAAVATLTRGGKVYALNEGAVPGAELAALLRY